MQFESGRHDYNSDPYYYTADNCRYNRGGRYYETNQYGANMLRGAVNNGYDQGFLAGQADQQDHWRADYQNAYAYQDANYGYDGYDISQVDYNYYFREGFRRGYEDGYYGRHQYGSYYGGNYAISGNLMGGIINFQSLQ